MLVYLAVSLSLLQGISMRGAKMLGTMAPLTEEILSFPFGGIAPGDDAYGLVFLVAILLFRPSGLFGGQK